MVLPTLPQSTEGIGGHCCYPQSLIAYRMQEQWAWLFFYFSPTNPNFSHCSFYQLNCYPVHGVACCPSIFRMMVIVCCFQFLSPPPHFSPCLIFHINFCPFQWHNPPPQLQIKPGWSWCYVFLIFIPPFFSFFYLLYYNSNLSRKSYC